MCCCVSRKISQNCVLSCISGNLTELCVVVFMQFLSGFKFRPLDRPLTTYDKFEFVDEYISEEKEVLRVKTEFEPIDKSSIKTIAEGKVGWLGRGTGGVATQGNGCTGVVFSSHPTRTSCPRFPSPHPPPTPDAHLLHPLFLFSTHLCSPLNDCILSVDSDNVCEKQS